MGSSNDSSSPEMHDVNWFDSDVVFDYTDPCLSYSSQVRAVLENNVKALEELLRIGKSININDNQGNTPLHISIMQDKREVFDFIISYEDTRLDVVNFQSQSALHLSIEHQRYYCAEELIKKGANINVTDFKGETPLFLACANNDFTAISLLMYYNADPSIPNWQNDLAFDISLSTCTEEIHESLMDYTFDQYSNEIFLDTFISLMKNKSNVFYKLIRLPNFRVNVTGKEDSLVKMWFSINSFSVEMFVIFVQKYLPKFNLLRQYVQWVKDYETNFFVDVFYKLEHTRTLSYFIHDCSNKNVWLHGFLIKNGMPEHVATEFVLYLLSHGMPLFSHYIDQVYRNYGINELFKILMNMNIILNEKTNCPMPRIIYDLNFEITEKFHKHSILRKYFSLTDNVASLLELARDRVRKILIQELRIENQCQFFYHLNRLPIADAQKKILSYEKQIYA